MPYRDDPNGEAAGHGAVLDGGVTALPLTAVPLNALPGTAIPRPHRLAALLADAGRLTGRTPQGLAERRRSTGPVRAAWPALGEEARR
ncbi:hypothetical protein Stube_19160 [Streptomyces tubercidicus]|uniref:Uncharacterized protein n=1 Tax=Streptomyces tubercidicus TaxID=47759 RepID=A0A640UMI9_9ACTN|nr:hypothetical protein Stube_19160 [Streptomyces tubercidicus]